MKKFLLFLPAIVFFIVGVFTMDHYGIGCDAPYHMLRGQAIIEIYSGKNSYDEPHRTPPILLSPGERMSRYYFSAIETGNTAPKLPSRPVPQAEFAAFSRASGTRQSFYHHEDWGPEYMRNQEDPGHLPFTDIIAAGFNRFFYGFLGVVGDLDSYQLSYLMFAAFAVLLTTVCAFDISGSGPVAAVAGLGTGLYPLFIAEAHVNMKDPAVTAFFVGAVWCFWHWVRENKLRWAIAFFGFIAMSLGTKWNVVFLPFILVPWLISIRKTPEFRRWFNLKKLCMYSCVACIACVAFMLIIWPYAWADPVGRLVKVWGYYWEIGVGGSYLQPTGMAWHGFNVYPFILFLTQTPLIVLVLFFVGLTGLIRRRETVSFRTGWLLLAWWAVTMLRMSVPPFRFYSGLRQIMELFPATGIIAGFGAYQLVRIKSGRYAKWVIGGIALCFIILVIDLIRLHPYEYMYTNSLNPVAAKIFGDSPARVTFGSSSLYKEAAEWMNAHAEKNANIAFLQGCDMALSPVWLRPDISISPNHFSGFDQKGEYIIYPLDPLNPAVFAARYPGRFLTPVYEKKVHGVTLYTIYKNDTAHAKLTLADEKVDTNVATSLGTSSTGDYMDIYLGSTRYVTRIVSAGFPGCAGNWDEFVVFLKSKSWYILNEKRVTSNNKVELLFPAEPATTIRIYPQSDRSCFAHATVSAVWYLPF